ncbi:U32 family peptidase [Desulfobacterales bacterium HSG2]|nr:U32 family peptidase [Desulfobacterales bacterium HSG2]
MHTNRLKIAAPVCSVKEAEACIKAGAKELYFGVMPDDWSRIFGESDQLTRRQGKLSHIRNMEEVRTVIQTAHNYDCSVSLAINARYSKVQESFIWDILQMWEENGGDAVILNDPGIIMGLRERASSLELHLSTLAGVFNSASAAFFAELGISRIILPRDLFIEEIGALILSGPDIAYEVIVMNQKCLFIDGWCGFFHDVRIPSDVPSEFDYEIIPGKSLPIVLSHDPEYEGHGCQINWRTDYQQVVYPERDDFHSPHCAACMLMTLFGYGVEYFKIAGRAYPVEMIIRAVNFIREAADIAGSCQDHEIALKKIRKLYEETFGEPCFGNKCYYQFQYASGERQWKKLS